MAIYNVDKDTGDITETAGKYGSSNSVFYGTIAQWNALTTAEKKAYDHASIPDSIDGGVTFPASKTMMSDGASVEADLASAVPRTVSGTTLAQLVSAVNQLSTEQKNRCSIYINDNRTLTYTANSYFACMVVTGSTYAISQYRFDPTNGGSYDRYIDGATEPSPLTISKWVLYYQGTPIS